MEGSSSSWIGFATAVVPTLFWVLLIGVLIGHVFRDPITQLIRRIKELGPKGLKAHDLQPGKPTTEKPELAAEAIDQKSTTEAITPMIRTWMEHYRVQLQKLAPTLEAQGRSEKDALLQSYAEQHWANSFQQTYGTIFGSQIQMLTKLNNNTDGKLSLYEAK